MLLEGLAEVPVEFDLQQAIGEGPPVAFSFAASHLGNPICGVFICSKLLRKCHFFAFFGCWANFGNDHLQGSKVVRNSTLKALVLREAIQGFR